MKGYFLELQAFLTALNLTPFKDVKVVIMGQYPYHGENQAHGLSYFVPIGGKLPPSLKNIFKELSNHIKVTRIHGNFENWASQGVLMINDALTVVTSKTEFHRNKRWEKFIYPEFEALNTTTDPIAFILWGNDAIKKFNC